MNLHAISTFKTDKHMSPNQAHFTADTGSPDHQ